MRRKSERTSSKKPKASPEKKVEKVKRTRTRRRKQSTSSENGSDEGSPVREVETVEPVEEPVKEANQPTPTTPIKEPSAEESQDQVWQVKTPEASGDGGEIQKLKICLTRPPSTPERADRSPRSKRKHSRATSSSDTPSSEGLDEKKRSRRSKRNRESKDEPDKDHDSQEEPEVQTDNIPDIIKEDPENEISQSTEHQKESLPEETPVSTTTDEKNTETVTQSKENTVENEQKEKSDADTTVTSPKLVTQNDEVNTSGKQSSEHRSNSVEKSEVLELHAEVDDSKMESSDFQSRKSVEEDLKKQEADNTSTQDRASSEGEVSINQDKSDESMSKEAKSAKNYRSKTTNETDVVESSVNVGNKEGSRKMSTDSEKEKDESVKGYRKKDVEHDKSTECAQDETVTNGPATPFVVSRKRKWGSRPKVTTQKSITISTDVLKEIIPDVKPVEFEEVIEDKKHKRIEVTEKIERPFLPKIIIDNTENLDKNNHDDMDHKENIKKETNLSANRRISIVKENDSIITRPPSPPRYKQSNVLYITNLVRPFTLPQLKNLLQRTGRIVENGFWIDRIKSKCFVQFENEDQAVETRHALHGVTWPVSNPKALQVDFSTQEAFEKAKLNEENETVPVSTIPGTVEDWLREQDMKRERGELEKPWERKAAMREWDMGKNEKDKEGLGVKDRLRRDDRIVDKRRTRSQERSPEPARKFKKKEEEAPAKLLDDLFRKTKTTPCIYWLPLSAETIAVKEEQRRKHMEEHERRLQELRRHRERDRRH